MEVVRHSNERMLNSVPSHKGTNHGLLKSFKYAFEGLSYVLKRERNMKIHFLSATGVIIFSMVIGLDAESALWVFLAIALVLITEIFNTFFEELLDFVNPQYSKAVKHMKDMAASGVLVAAVFAIVVTIQVFGKRFNHNLSWISEVVLLGYMLMVAILTITGGGKSEKNKGSDRR